MLLIKNHGKKINFGHTFCTWFQVENSTRIPSIYTHLQ